MNCFTVLVPPLIGTSDQRPPGPVESGPLYEQPVELGGLLGGELGGLLGGLGGLGGGGGGLEGGGGGGGGGLLGGLLGDGEEPEGHLEIGEEIERADLTVEANETALTIFSSLEPTSQLFEQLSYT